MKKSPQLRRRKKRGPVFSSIRWTIERAAAEFVLDRRTVSNRIRAAGILPGEDKCYSTAEMHAAICGDYEKERTRKMKEEADGAAIANATSRGELVDKLDFMKRYEIIYAAIRQKIYASNMSDADKDALLLELQQLHTA